MIGGAVAEETTLMERKELEEGQGRERKGGREVVGVLFLFLFFFFWFWAFVFYLFLLFPHFVIDLFCFQVFCLKPF